MKEKEDLTCKTDAGREEEKIRTKTSAAISTADTKEEIIPKE